MHSLTTNKIFPLEPLVISLPVSAYLGNWSLIHPLNQAEIFGAQVCNAILKYIPRPLKSREVPIQDDMVSSPRIYHS